MLTINEKKTNRRQPILNGEKKEEGYQLSIKKIKQIVTNSQ